ncbi:MAG: hypothetical protein GXP51_04025 [Deltaproteobacteria bacterium]|nr:hypothetical protein [Deltaproteobacteria bacterium]
MLNIFISLCTATVFLLCGSLAGATTLSDSLLKYFKTISYPEKEVVARITLQTDIPQIEGDRVEDSVLLSYKAQAKLVSVFKKHGWQADDPLEIDPIDAGVIELKLGKGMNLKFKETLRLKAYVYQCDMPMHKYRGGDIGKFFEKDVLEKAEQCFTYDEKLQGKNYPY